MTFGDDPDLLINHGCMALTLKPKPNHPNGIVQKSQTRKKHDKFCKILRFCSLYSSIAMARCILNSCYKIVWPIKITTLTLCADGNSHRIVEKAIMLVRKLLSKNKTIIMHQPPY